MKEFDMGIEGLDMFDPPPPPPPPTGPEVEPYNHEDGRPGKYLTFMATNEGKLFWAALVDAALLSESRFSTRTFVARYRDDQKVRINNDYSPWLADDLVVQYPQLLEIVERRKRKKSGPTT